LSIETTRQTIKAYLVDHDPQFLAEDAIFVDLASGQETKGRRAITQMLDWFYHQAFDARAEVTNIIACEGAAAFEGYVTGRHIGEFAGMAATGKDVRVPISVTYDLEDGQITGARIYFMANVLMNQLGLANG
jgi:steroid delta-isomerase-like uncharacterized protein